MGTSTTRKPDSTTSRAGITIRQLVDLSMRTLMHLPGRALLDIICLTATFLHEVTAGREKEEVKSETITVNPDRKQAYFTESPYAFVPRGLIMVEYPGIYNGRIIVWKDPISSITIFEIST